MKLDSARGVALALTLDGTPAADTTLEAAEIELGPRIGRGAFGEVYRGFDRQLKRPIAVKLLRVGDQSVRDRLLAEAQAQARVDHPNVCKVYGMGVLDGDPFIAMQLIDGTSLRNAAASLTLRERLEMLAQVCDGLEAAHEAGVIHRDIKPHNVLVERHGGGWRAFIVDFGLARQVNSTAGHLAGTPSYMAPEQIQSGTLDARTDVWGVGATLYDLFAGKAPFAAGSVAATLDAVLHAEPPSLRQVDRSLPPEIDWIVKRCLEKPPARRYSSARAVAADLRRLLDNQPVVAGPGSTLYRIGKLARRHRLPVALAAAGLVVALGLTLALVRHRARAEELTHRAQSYARDVERFELVMRQAYMKPAHELEDDRRPLRARLAEIARDLPLLDGESLQVARLALGKGYLAIGAGDESRRYLQAAWDAGMRDAELQFTMGEALAEQYHQALERARLIDDPVARKSVEARAAVELRDAALPHLRAGWSAVESPALVEAMMLADGGKLDDAERMANKLAADEPWRFEAVRLVADVERTRGNQLEESGKLRDGTAAFSRAWERYGDALKIAPSDPRSREGRCLTALALTSAAYNTSTLGTVDVASWQRACDGHPATQARILVYEARHVIDNEHGDGQPLLREGLRLAESAPAGYDRLVAIITVSQHYGDAVYPDPAWRDLRRRGIAACREAARLGPMPDTCFFSISDYVAYTDPPYGDALLAEITPLAEKRLAEAPSSWMAAKNRAVVRHTLAQRAAAHGRPADWRNVLAAYARADALNPEVDVAAFNAGATALEWATEEIFVGGDSDEALAQAAIWIDRARKIDPRFGRTANEEVQLELLRALRAIQSGADALPFLRAAEAAAATMPNHGARYTMPALIAGVRYLAAPATSTAMPAPPSDENAVLTLGTWLKKVHALTLEHADVMPTIRDGRAAMDRGYQAIPFYTQFLAYRGLLQLEAAKAAAAADQRREAQQAVDELTHALDVNPRLAHVIGNGLQEARDLAR